MPSRLPTDASADPLIRTYELAEAELRAIIRAAAARGAKGTEAYFRRQSLAVGRILEELRARTPDLVEQAVEGSYNPASAAASAVMGVEHGFSGVDQGAVETMVRALHLSLDGAARTVGRSADDVFRRVAAGEIATGLARGDARRGISNRIKQRLADEGTTSFVDRAGRRWRLEVYARMATRTTTREAVTVAGVNRLQALGSDLISISSHNTTTPLCKQFEGKTYSISGDDPRYEKLPALPPFHPNCQHVAHPAAASFEDFERELGLGPSEAPEPGPEATPAAGSDPLFSAFAAEDKAPKLSRQPIAQLDPLRAQAEETKPEFDRLLDLGEGLQRRLGAEVFTAFDVNSAQEGLEGAAGPRVILTPIKSEESTARKVRDKYRGDASRIGDLVRGSISVESLSDIPDAVEALRQEARERGWTIRAPENRFSYAPGSTIHTGPTAAGYRDVAVQLIAPNGHITEFQITTRPMAQAKFGAGHALYEEERLLDAKAPRTPAEDAELDRLRAEQRQLYDEAFRLSAPS